MNESVLKITFVINYLLKRKGDVYGTNKKFKSLQKMFNCCRYG